MIAPRCIWRPVSALSHSLAAVNGGEKDRSGVRGLWNKEGRYRDVHEQRMGYRRKRGRIRKVEGKVGRWDLPEKKILPMSLSSDVVNSVN